MIHQFFLGLLLGWGAAIPIGPMNLEMMRRNLHYGARYAFALGGGVCSADITYLIILSLGVVSFLSNPRLLQVVGFLGSLILAWFGYGALRLKATPQTDTTKGKVGASHALWRHTLEGYVLTLINPFTVLFWSSVSTQLQMVTAASAHAWWFTGIGVLVATSSWVIVFNSTLHYARHYISPSWRRGLNISGGLILLMFAAWGFWRAYSLI